MRQAISLLDTLPEEADDMDSSDDNDDVLTISDEEELPDSGESDSSGEEEGESSGEEPVNKKLKKAAVNLTAPPPFVAVPRGAALVAELAMALERNVGAVDAAAEGGEVVPHIEDIVKDEGNDDDQVD